MMENKPIVTCHGDQALFSKLHPLVVRGLVREAVEWKRSYGRPSRTVHVEATFVPFNPSILPSDDDWTLLGRTFFHTYWTECDVEGYRMSVKEEISEWLAALKEKDFPDWLIIVVVNEDSRVKSRLLRNSVYDKVKNDFCNKLQDRCVVLSEPLKNDAKASESWSSVLSKLRQLLLDAYSRNLGRFEEFMRAQRERRTDAKWSYCSYFLLQEELAFMYEMLGLFEDALVQYDELDALFTQFVLNFAMGDNAPWLVNFSKHPATRWDGLCLSQPINISKRQMIKHQEASLLDLRNYLFSRQCTLLFLLSRPWEVGQRAIPFMHNCIKELRILEITLPAGAIDCWVYLSCLEVLNVCEKMSHLGHMETYSLCTASLWDYARTKISCLGQLCGLMHPGSPTSKELHLVVELLTGLVRAEGDSEPLENLKEVLSSKEAFHKRYLELSELAMCSFKHIGRLRSARKVGKDLANFHMLLNEPEKAESYLHDSVKMFKAEGWEMLANDTRMDIAWCQKTAKQAMKYCRTCMYITSSPTLPNDTRLRYQRELENLGSSSHDSPILVRCAPVFYVSDIEPVSDYFIHGKPTSLKLNLLSNLVEPITVDTVCISVIFWTPAVDLAATEQIPSRRRSQANISRRTSCSERSIHSREPSGSSVVGIDLYNRIQETIQASSQSLDLHALVDIKVDEGTTSSSAVICRSPLRRLKSIPGVTKEKEIVKDEWDLFLVATNQVLKPGNNEVVVSATLNSSGCYLVNQLCLKFNGIECFKTLTSECVTLSVINNEPTITLEPEHDPLVAGISQDICLSLNSSAELYDANEPLKLLVVSDGLLLVSEHLSEDGSLKSLGEVPVQINISALAVVPEASPDCICHEVVLSGGNLKKKIVKNLKFVLPLKMKHFLHTANKRKFVQVIVVGHVDTCLVLSQPVLDSSDASVSFLSFCDALQPVVMRKDQTASFLWEVRTNGSLHNVQVPCTFQVHFQTPDVKSVPQEQKYCFMLDLCVTLFSVTSALISNDELTMDKSYSAMLTVNCVAPKAPISSQPLLYEVTYNEKAWNVTGELKGEVILKNNRFEVPISVCPLKSGYLYLPSIQLLQEISVPVMKEVESETSTGVQNSLNQFTSGALVTTKVATAELCDQATQKAIEESSEDDPVKTNDTSQFRERRLLKPLTNNEVYDCCRAQPIYVCARDIMSCQVAPVGMTEVML